MIALRHYSCCGIWQLPNAAAATGEGGSSKCACACGGGDEPY